MTLIQKFKEEVLSDAAQFELQEDKNKTLYFVKYRTGKAIYVYGDYSYSGKLAMDMKLSLKAILSDENIYVVDSYPFYRFREEVYPENVYCFSDKVKEVNDFIQNVLFPKYYDKLPTRALTDDEQIDVVRRIRRVVLQENSVIKGHSIGKIMDSEHVAKLLRGELDVEEFAAAHFEKNKEHFITIKSENHELQKLVDAKHEIKDWEINMANSLRDLDAKNVTVEFSINGEQGTEKVEKDRLLRMLYDKDYFSSYKFVNGKSGAALLKKLNVGDYSTHVNGVLRCEHISSIKYGKKVIYSVMQYS